MPSSSSKSNTSGSANRSNSSEGKFTPMTKSDASRIQSSQARGGEMSSSGFAARAQSAGERNANAGIGRQQNTGHK
ncbi:hypothetical protein K469DRAFT_596921 [Zopfia rhizophila CBS 207.26]|uniref:Uncharacterized protein n=1 Tax=Zopfia rhizophila CBS 207.26 TaxID=1314779 RepID=A0A6A6DNR3_9PEZI|nr:hypothetical protein K469DRAFT_596921 [Zopfia rhizophila CBS 207.26]